MAAGAWTRVTDIDAWTEVPGAFTFVEQGTVNADTGWVSTADTGGTLNTTAITWAQFSGAGSITAGAGMTKTGATLDVIGTADRITVAADSVDISSTYVGQASITTLGTITTGTWTGTTIAVANGGTGQTTAKAAQGVGSLRGRLLLERDPRRGDDDLDHGCDARLPGLPRADRAGPDGGGRGGRPAGHRRRRQRGRDRDLRQLAVGEHDPGDGDRLMPEVVGRLRTPRLSTAPASPQTGELYYDTDDNVLYVWNGTAWQHPGFELAYAQSTSAVNVIQGTEATAQNCATAPALTFDGATAVLIEFYAELARPAASAAASLTFWLYDGSSSVGAVAAFSNPSAGTFNTPVYILRRLTPSAGSHTYGIRASVSVATALVHAGSGGAGQDAPMFIRISRV